MFKKLRGLTGIVGLIAFILVVPTLHAANRDFNKIDTIRIGALGPIQMAVGMGITNAAKMAAEEINAAGGILGKKVEIILGDTEGKPEKGITALKKLVLDDNVDVLLGEWSSGAALAMQPFANSYKVVYVATGIATIDFTNNVKKDYQKYRYTFRHMINSERQQQGGFRFLKEFVNANLGYKKFAILAENAKWTEDFGPMMKKDLEAAGMEVVFYERFDVDLKDFSPVFAKIRANGAQWIAQAVSHAASITMVKAWQDNKPAPMGCANFQSMDTKFWEVTGGACLYESTYNMIARAPLTDKTIPFWDKYVAKYGIQPIYNSPFTYDMVYMFTEVIKQKKSVKSDDIVAGLENINYKGVLHPQTGFDKQSHDLLEGRYVMPIVQWQPGGKQIVIFPKEFKTGDYINPSWWKQ